MAVNRLFINRSRTFWSFQIVGWVGYFMVRILHGVTAGQEIEYYLSAYVSAAIVGFLMTTLMRYLYRFIRERSLLFVVVGVISISTLFGLLLSSVELSVAASVFEDDLPFQGLERFSNAMFETTVLLAWSALYFGYYFYTGFNEQKERALKATAMAHQAQLKMLRYQLNPHFLFNTLNAISTLVLEKAGTEANEMLTKLSSFLRYTLHNQPNQKVTLEQELHALRLYLDIERVRFGDRLKIEYDIADNALKSLIPSLIMQPLVENAIKYAIAPALDGGTITFKAVIIDGALELVLTDTGPGLEDIKDLASKSGSGVGLVNTKDRLSQIYGSRHQLTVKNISPAGLGIYITIPNEKEGVKRRSDHAEFNVR